jgi:cytochrome c5
MRFLAFWMGIIGVGLAATVSFAELSGTLDEKHILERIKPEGEVTIEAGGQAAAKKPTTTASGDIGKQRYDEFCHTCHESGLAGAPKFGDKADWAPRIAEGMDTMMKRAIQGYKAMPPKGTCSNCSDEEIKKAIEYMVSHSK